MTHCTDVDGLMCLTGIPFNSWIMFTNHNLFNISRVYMRVSSTVGGGGSIEMRLGSLSGQLLCNVVVPEATQV
jgi:hypothetical protein